MMFLILFIPTFKIKRDFLASRENRYKKDSRLLPGSN